MRPIWKNGVLTVSLHKPDEAILRKARTIGMALMAMNQETGEPLVAAVDAILGAEEEEE